jgi:hypothetical protein
MAQVKTRPKKAAVARKVAPARNGHAALARAERLSPAVPRPGEDGYREQPRSGGPGVVTASTAPSNCPFRVYVGKDGEVWREAVGPRHHEKGRADFNPSAARRASRGTSCSPARSACSPLKRAGAAARASGKRSPG